ncbi:MAG: hypothetical protein QOI32_7 [Thermoleophilaceae bacterium]|nr:hypothetical protein [Thermoleophilaceae bacterium]
MAVDVNHEEFLTVVSQHADVGFERAEQATRAVLETLAERIDAGEARDLAERLPPELAPFIGTIEPAHGFDADEFIRRVAEREGIDTETAERHVTAVFAALARAVGPDEYDDLVAELSKDYWPLLARGPHVEVLSAEAFRQRVADRAGIDLAAADRAIDAVLETLAERIAGGEVDDLIDRLPQQLHEPLRRGGEHTGGKATRMSLEEFVDRVAEREGSGYDAALEHAQAVFMTLREAVGDEEFSDVTVELPREYVNALAPL